MSTHPQQSDRVQVVRVSLDVEAYLDDVTRGWTGDEKQALLDPADENNGEAREAAEAAVMTLLAHGDAEIIDSNLDAIGSRPA